MAQQTELAKPKDEFVPTTGGAETTSAETMLILAYLVLWFILIGFVSLCWRRQRETAARLTQVEKALQRPQD